MKHTGLFKIFSRYAKAAFFLCAPTCTLSNADAGLSFTAGHIYSTWAFGNTTDVVEYSADGTFLDSLTIPSLKQDDELRGIAFGPDGLLYAVMVHFADSGYQVLALDSSGTVHQTYRMDGIYLFGGGAPPNSPGGRSVTYYLDRAGNRKQINDNVNESPVYTSNAINQYTTVTGYNITNGPEHEISKLKGPNDTQQVGYNYINDERLSSVKIPALNPTTTYSLSYDALGRCVKRTLNNTTTYYIYDGEKPILEYKSNDLTNPVKNVYGKGIDEILMRTENGINSGQPFYYCQDHEGSVTHLLNSNGNIIETYSYDAFGAPTFYNAAGTQITSTAYNNRFLFTGREYAAAYRGTYVASLAFYEYRARAYSPALGRFMSEDPKLFVRRAGLGAAPADWAFAAHPDEAEFNLFRYCGNDPVDFSDPMGLMTDGLVAEPERRDVAPAVVLGHAAIIAALAAPAAEAAVGRAAVAAASRSPTVARVVAAIAAAFKVGQARNSSSSSAAKPIANPVPSTMARVIPERISATTLARPGAPDVFVTAAKDIAGKNASQIAHRLGIPQSPTGFRVFEFATPQSGVASPVFRTGPGFVGGGLTSGGAREFVIPNGPIPPDAVMRTVP